MPGKVQCPDHVEISFLQSSPWGTLKEEFGWKCATFTRPPLIILTRRIGRVIPFAYVPWGLADIHDYSRAYSLLRDFARQLSPRPLILRWDLPHLLPSLEENRKEENALTMAGFSKAADVQVSSTVMLDLKKDDTTLLSEMKAKTRYNIRLARKKGVRIRSIGPEDMHLWYDLHCQTARRQKIAIRPLQYYTRIMQLFSCRCTLAEHATDILAGILVLHWGKTATYLFGGSSDYKQNFMAGYYLHWEALQYARMQGMYSYDFFGISRDADPSDPLYGLYKFKTGFGGKIFYRPGAWDLDMKPVIPFLIRIGEKIRK